MGEVAVFVETNLGTRIAMTVPLDITSPDFMSMLVSTKEKPYLLPSPVITPQVFSFDSVFWKKDFFFYQL